MIDVAEFSKKIGFGSGFALPAFQITCICGKPVNFMCSYV
jgi:hypothetical protein